MHNQLYCALVLLWATFFVCSGAVAKSSHDSDGFLTESQALSTSGARAVELFRIDGQQFLAIPQLAEDIPDSQPNMNGGNSDVDSIVYKYHDGVFTEFQRIPAHGGEDAEYFQIGEQHYLAICGVRSGSGPYNANSYATIYQFDGLRFYPVQEIATFAAKQCRHFSMGDRHFLGIANGVVIDGLAGDTNSPILEWSGNKFRPFQVIPTQWAYNWTFFEESGEAYLFIIDHLDGSTLYKWNETQFDKVYLLAEKGARAMTYFRLDGVTHFAYANIQGDSRIYRFTDQSLEQVQVLADKGGREFYAFEYCNEQYLVRVNFITGPRNAPVTLQQSQVYRWNGKRFIVVSSFETFGGTDAATFSTPDGDFLAVSNSLSKDIRFRVDSVVYGISTDEGREKCDM